MIWQVEVPGEQTVTAHAGFVRVRFEQFEPFTVRVSTLLPEGALFTVRSVESDAPPQVAAIVVVPVASEVTRPLEPAVLLIVATD